MREGEHGPWITHNTTIGIMESEHRSNTQHNTQHDTFFLSYSSETNTCGIYIHCYKGRGKGVVDLEMRAKGSVGCIGSIVNVRTEGKRVVCL